MSERARALEQAVQYRAIALDAIAAWQGQDDRADDKHRRGTSARTRAELRSRMLAVDAVLLAVAPPPSGASPQAETSEAEQKYGIAFGRLDGESIDEHIASIKRLMGILAPVSPVEPEPPEELPCYCDIPSHILDLGCPRHQAPQCEPEPPKTWSLEIINRTGFTVEPEPCVWREDEDGIWETSCGASWVFIDGSPSENNTKFCHNCGHPVQPVAYVERFDDDEDEAGAPLKVER